ncbi:MAG: N-acetylmuramoyl-L-alanine amidase [Myxococcota bacterium]
MRALALLVLVSLPALAQESWIDDCGLEPPGSVPVVPLEPKPWEPNLVPESPALVRVERPALRIGGLPAASVRGVGALANKVVYLSPGHGFTWEAGLGAWRTQRGNTNNIVEDLVSIETLSQYLMPMLLNAGARVVPVRELDLNSNLVIVDNGEAGYVETGSGFIDSTLMGFGRPTFPMTGATLPFSLGGNRLMPSAATATASASYTANIPASGYYEVSVSYTSFTARVTDAHYIVRHAGGETHFRVNQQRHGGTWVQLGRFYFRQGGTAQVVVQNDSAAGSGMNVSLDAVKFGGGMGFIDRGAGTSGRPRFEESARYHAQWSGAPTSVWAANGNTPADDRTNDVGTRSRFAAWVHEPGEDAVYVAWHTNAFNASAVGTNTYVYGPNPPDGTLNFTGVDGGMQLANAVHGELVRDIKADAGWNRPTWTDRGVDSAYFGELNPGNNPETPSTLIEVAFHDAAADAAHLKEPAFRYLAARAITQGIIKYFAQKDGVTARLPPEPPTHVAALNQGNGEAVLRWRASPTDTQGVRGDAATGYRVYSSDDGLAWDDGVDVATTSARVSLPAGAPKFFRVTATNAGGESFPSAVVGVKAPVPGKPLVLVVNGFDRLEAAIGKTETFASTYALGNVLRIFVAKMNDGTAARLTGDALAANDVGFDTAESDAVTAGDVATSPYQLLTWFLGRGKQGGAALTAAEQGVVTDFRTRNVPVFFTGDSSGSASFVSTTFSGSFPGTTGGLALSGAGPLNGLNGLALDDGNGGSFSAGAPPVVDASGAAISLGAYVAGGNAAIGTPMQSVVFGFPFETLVDRTQRVEVMRRVLAFLAPAGFDGGVVMIDAGTVIDAGVEPDAGSPTDAGTPEVDAGMSGVDGGAAEDAGVVRQPVLAFQGGGCSVTGSALPLAAAILAVFTARRRRDSLARRDSEK